MTRSVSNSRRRPRIEGGRSSLAAVSALSGNLRCVAHPQDPVTLLKPTAPSMHRPIELLKMRAGFEVGAARSRCRTITSPARKTTMVSH
jgi:hypothetical protein